MQPVGPSVLFARKGHTCVQENLRGDYCIQHKDSIKKAAEHQGDEDMLHMLRSVNDDLVASDAKYNKNCFSLYVAKKVRCTIPHFKNWVKT